KTQTIPEKNNINEENEDDLGLLDALEAFAERSIEVSEIANRISIAHRELTEKMNQRTQEISSLTSFTNQATPTQARHLISKAAEDMLQFSSQIEAEIPTFRIALNSCMEALTKAATLSLDFDKSQMSSAK